jgi:acetyltransferase-like isoleucine patch superfamily enzyme
VQTAADIPMALGGPQSPRGGGAGWWTRFYRMVLRRHGIKFGPGLRVLGPVQLQIDGKGSNIVLGRNVTLMPGAHLKNRENGRIVLHDGVKLDSVTRLVAANDATIELGENTAIGLGTIINAGADVRIGRYGLIAGHCVMSASDHGFEAGAFIREQPYTYDEIRIGQDVWLGAHTFVSKGARIGDGAVVSAGSFVAGEIPPGAIARGRPAEVVKFRE